MVLTFLATGIGVAFSFMASSFQQLAIVVVWFCFLFSLAIGYSAAANYLASKARRAGGGQAPMRSFRLSQAYRKPTRLDQFLAGSGVALLALLVLIPTGALLVRLLSETLRFSEDAAYTAQVVGHAGAVGLGLFFGWWNWQHVSRNR